MDMLSCFFEMETDDDNNNNNNNNNVHYIFDNTPPNYASNLSIINATGSDLPPCITTNTPSSQLLNRPAAEALLHMHMQEQPMEAGSYETQEAYALSCWNSANNNNNNNNNNNSARYRQNNLISNPSGLELALRARHLLFLPVTPAPIRRQRSETQKWRVPDAELVNFLMSFKSQSEFCYYLPLPSLTVAEADVYSAHPSELLNSSAQAFICLTSYCRWGPRYTRLRRTKDGFRWKQQGRAFTIVSNGLPRANKTYLSYRSPPSSHAHQQDGQRKACICGKRKYAAFTMEEIALTENVLHEKIQIANGEMPTPFPIICRISDHSKGSQRCLCSTISSAMPTSSSSSSNESIIQNEINKALFSQDPLNHGKCRYYSDVSSSADVGSSNALCNSSSSSSSFGNVLSPSNILLSDNLHTHILQHQLCGSSTSLEEHACFYSLIIICFKHGRGKRMASEILKPTREVSNTC